MSDQNKVNEIIADMTREHVRFIKRVKDMGDTGYAVGIREHAMLLASSNRWPHELEEEQE